MGGTRWSDEHYHDRARKLKRQKRSAFGFDEDIRKGHARAGVHEKLDPKNFRNGFARRVTVMHSPTVPRLQYCLM